MCQVYRKRQTTPGWPRTWSLPWQQVTFSLSRKGASFQHDRFHYVALSWHWSFAAVLDFVCVYRPTGAFAWCKRHRNTTFPCTNTRFDKTVCVWIVGSSCGVKDSVLSQPVVNCAHDFSSFITVEPPNTAQQQVHADHRIFDRLAAFVRQCFDEAETCHSAQCDQQKILTRCRPLAIFQ